MSREWGIELLRKHVSWEKKEKKEGACNGHLYHLNMKEEHPRKKRRDMPQVLLMFRNVVACSEKKKKKTFFAQIRTPFFSSFNRIELLLEQERRRLFKFAYPFSAAVVVNNVLDVQEEETTTSTSWNLHFWHWSHKITSPQRQRCHTTWNYANGTWGKK